jgi:hypothetical protein
MRGNPNGEAGRGNAIVVGCFYAADEARGVSHSVLASSLPDEEDATPLPYAWMIALEFHRPAALRCRRRGSSACGLADYGQGNFFVGSKDWEMGEGICHLIAFFALSSSLSASNHDP